jgi:hypothetical protein
MRIATLPVVRLAATMLIGLCALALGGCGDTLQDNAIPHNILESLIESPFPVYWLGGSFQGLAVREATHDPGDAFSVQYGDCLSGGQGECIPPLRVVSSPDNSFLPGGSTSARTIAIRGTEAVLANGGRAIAIATGGVVLDIYAKSSQLALAAAQAAVPINAVGAPEAPLPTRLPNTGFGEAPLSFQTPKPPRPLR